MSGFLAIHQDALAVCEDCAEVSALVWLCRQGDLYGWGEPFEATTATLILQTRCFGKAKSRGWVSSFLARMVRRGAIEVTDKGDRHRPRLVSVVNPFPPKPRHDAEHDPIHDAIHDAIHQDGPESPDIVISKTPGNTPGNTPGKTQTPQYEEQTKTEDPRRRPQTKTLSIAIQAIWDHWRTLAKGYGLKPSKESTAALKKWLDVTDVESVCIWLDYCIHGHPWYREKRITKLSVFLRDQVREDGLVESRQWHERGRTTAAPKARPDRPLTDWERLEAMKSYNNPNRVEVVETDALENW